MKSELAAERTLGTTLQEQLSVQLQRCKELAASECKVRDALAAARASQPSPKEVAELKEELAAVSKELAGAKAAAEQRQQQVRPAGATAGALRNLNL